MEANERFKAVLAAVDVRRHRLLIWLEQMRQLVALFLELGAAYIASLIARHSWVRGARNALFYVLAFIVGSTYEDAVVAFSKPELVKNDAYRDRLLEPEIADLVDLSDALQLTIPQRKAVFQCFLHVDFMRRAGVTRTELLRYCNLRLTPLTCFLLPESIDGATHRGDRGVGRRWDIMQWIAVCFSVCTLELNTLVQATIVEACRPKVMSYDLQQKANSSQELGSGLPSTPRPEEETEDDLCDQITRCFEFCTGVLNTQEMYLQSLLRQFYCRTGDLQKAATQLDFRQIHGVQCVADVVRLFPGSSTWQFLRKRRRELQAVGMNELFPSFTDIITAARIQLHRKQQQGLKTKDAYRLAFKIPLLSSRNGGHNSGGDFALRDMQIFANAAATQNTEARVSTPRKILPSIDIGFTLKKFGSKTAMTVDPVHVDAPELSYASETEAWKVTANHVLASVYLGILFRDSDLHNQQQNVENDASTIFHSTTKDIFDGKIAPEACEVLRKTLVCEYGYQFTKFLFEKSSLKEMSAASKSSPEERRAQLRHKNAWKNLDPPEDKSRFWKQFVDPASKCAFYYNIRTGESRWEQPSTFVSPTKKAKTKKRKLKAP